MNLAPDIELAGVMLLFPNGTRRLYWQPSCLRCRWQDEPHPTKGSAQIAAGEHLHNGCLMDVPEEGDDEMPA